jgi:hypothetical protein
MLPLRKHLLRASIDRNAHMNQHRHGDYETVDALLAASQASGHLFLAPSALNVLRQPGFKIGAPGEYPVAFVTPAELGFSKPATPPELFARGIELGLAACPESLPFVPQSFSYTPINRKPYLYAVRHFERKWSWVFLKVTPIDDSICAIGTWHGQTPVHTDISVGFWMPEDAGTD